MKIRVATFTLPGDEREIEKIKNEELVNIINEKLVASTKECIILVYLEYEDYRL